MRVDRILIVIVCLSVFAAATTVAQANELGKAFYLRGAGSMGTWSMGDFNDALDRDKDMFQDFGFRTGYEDIGAVLGFGFEMGVRVSSMLSVGVGFGYESNTPENSATLNGILDLGGGPVEVSQEVSDDYELSIWEITANVAFWVPAAPGMYLGASAGIGNGSLTETLFVRFDDGSFVDTFSESGEYDGSGFVGSIFGGYQHEFDSAPVLFVETGFRLRNLGTFDGSFSSNDIGVKEDGELTDLNGEAVGDMNYSGLYLRAGVGIAVDI
jgi:hypothetical protein